MSDNVRRFDDLVRTVRGLKGDQDDFRRTVMARLAIGGGGGGGGAVSSVNGETGAVVLDAADVGAQPADSDLTTIAGLAPSNGAVLRRVAGAWAGSTLTASDVGAAASSHTHGAGDVTSGTFDIARVPTGTTSSTVALGDHNHDGRYYTEAETDTRIAAAYGDLASFSYVSNMETTTSTAYTNLATFGPQCTITLPTARDVVVFLKSELYQTGAAAQVFMSYETTGANVFTAGDHRAVVHNGSGNPEQYGSFYAFAFAAGTTTITAKYRVVGGTGRFQYRQMVVIPL